VPVPAVALPPDDVPAVALPPDDVPAVLLVSAGSSLHALMDSTAIEPALKTRQSFCRFFMFVSPWLTRRKHPRRNDHRQGNQRKNRYKRLSSS
jgi:hypothetical protein